MIEWSEKYKKVDTLSIACEEYKRKDYLSKLNLAQSRLKFRERSNCMKTCRVHYSSDKENIRALFQCHHCDKIDSFPIHWRTCESYSKFRESKCLDNDIDLINYYQQIINRSKNKTRSLYRVTVMTSTSAIEQEHQSFRSPDRLTTIHTNMICLNVRLNVFKYIYIYIYTQFTG